jgi:hypothetical protein
MNTNLNWNNAAAVGALLRGDLENALVAATPGGIVAQEKRGQQQLVNSTMFPKDGNATDEQLVDCGFVLGEDIDDLFRNVTLPNGWAKVGTGHDMHSDLLDEQGNKRGGIFYKAAFYDRRADFTLYLRYYVSTAAPDDNDWSSDQRFYVVRDRKRDTVIYKTEIYKRTDWTAADKHEEEAFDWLAEHYPDYSDFSAYW